MINYFKNINLTNDQQIAIESIQEFLSSDRNIFILKGYAGTGKTTLLKGIGEFLRKDNRLGNVMAPTGRAAKIIRDKTGLPASTIHKAIYDFNNLQPVAEEDNDENKSFKFFFGLRNNEHGIDKVYFADEASMIGDNFNEGEFFRFGSGKLLSDLLKYVDLNSSINHKIIFIGDPAQLEPVSDKESKALNPDYFKGQGYSVDETEMKQVVRQAEESGILANSIYYRKLIEAETCNTNVIDLSYEDITKIDTHQLGHLFTSIAPIPEIGKTSVITYSNNLAYDYNKLLRQRYFPEQENAVPGDLLLVTQNNYRQSIELLNGEIIKVIDASALTETQTSPVIIDGVKKNVSLTFRNVSILVPGYDNVIDVKIIDGHLNSRHRDLSRYEIKALYINFVMRYRERTNNQFKEGSQEFKDSLKTDPYFNALRVKYGYALTCHKAQGGEWNSVFVDFRGRIGLSKSHLRWDYTAITRASKKLFVLNPPNLKPVSFLKFSPVGRIGNIPANMYFYGNVDITPYHTQSTHPAVRLKYREIEDKIRDTEFTISIVESRPYLEMYFFNSGDNNIRIDINYKESGLFTRIISHDASEESKKIIDLINSEYNWPIEFEYETQNEVLSYLFQTMTAVCEESNTSILNIDESGISNFYVIYFFKTQADCAYIQFYFNKKGQVTSAIPKSTLGEEDEILTKLVENLKVN